MLRRAMRRWTNKFGAVARDVCGKSPARTSASDEDLRLSSFCHSVAAELDARLIDETGRKTALPNFESTSEAYRDWCQRYLERGRLARG